MSPVAGAEHKRGHASDALPARAEAVLRWERSDRVVPGLHEIRDVAGHRQPAKQGLNR